MGAPKSDAWRRMFPRVALVAFALFFAVPIVGHFAHSLSKPHQQPIQANMFRRAQDEPDALALAAAATRELSVMYPTAVVRDGGEIGKTGVYRFVVRSPHAVDLERISTWLPEQFVVCPAKATRLEKCPPAHPGPAPPR